MTTRIKAVDVLLLCLLSLSAAWAQVPAFTAAGVVNAASFTPPISAGSPSALFGNNLASTTPSDYPRSAPLPTTLGGTTVRLNGIAAPLYFVSPSQINFQVPWELAGQTSATVTVTSGSSSSNPVTVNLASFAPGIFTTNASGTGAAYIANPDGSVNSSSKPAHPGDQIQLFCVGLGPAANQPASGAGAGINSDTSTSPSVSIGGLSASVIRSQLLPSSNFLVILPSGVGVYLVTVQVPGAVTADSAVPLTLSIGGMTAKTATVTIAPRGTDSVSPLSLSFSAVEGSSPVAQPVSITGTASGAAWQTTVATSSGGNWLSVSPGAGLIPTNFSVLVNSASLPAGVYQGTVTLQIPAATPGTQTISVTLAVTAASTGQLTASPASLSAQTSSGTNPAPQHIRIGNSGGGTINWTAAASTVNGGNWLSVAPASGSASLQGPVDAQVSFSTQGLPAGVYTGQIALSPGSLKVPVRLVVSPSAAALLLEQTGMTLTGIQGAGSLAAQPVIVANSGGGTLNWTADVLMGSWLGVTPASGTSTAGSSPPALQVQANASGLNAGTYYGLARVTAAGASNSPQYLVVVLNLLPSTTRGAGTVFPRGLIFVAPAGGAISTSQDLTLATTSVSPVTALAFSQTTSGNWLTVTSVPVILSPTGAMPVNVNPASLATGVYQGTVTVAFGDGSQAQTVNVVLVVTSGPAAVPQSSGFQAAACTPSKLLMVMRQLGSNFSSAVGWPVILEAQVVDDCGSPATWATVLASFSNGDAPLVLSHLGKGIYSTTWKPGTANPGTVTVRAAQTPLSSALLTVNGQVVSNALTPPAVGSGGVVNAAGFTPAADVAPGAIVSIFGSNLAAANNLASFPLPTVLGGIKMTMGGIDMPLFFAGPGQVNAQVPFELPVNSQTQVVAHAISGSTETTAVPEPVTVGAAHPGIFLTTGSQGAILNVQNQLVDSTSPARSGDIITIYCTGLGVTTPRVATGQPSPGNPPATVAFPVVTIGGANAAVQFAGLTPGSVGLYQVNVTVPAGLTPGAAVPVVITQSGVPSNTATMAIR